MVRLCLFFANVPREISFHSLFRVMVGLWKNIQGRRKVKISSNKYLDTNWWGLRVRILFVIGYDNNYHILWQKGFLLIQTLSHHQLFQGDLIMTITIIILNPLPALIDSLKLLHLGGVEHSKIKRVWKWRHWLRRLKRETSFTIFLKTVVKLNHGHTNSLVRSSGFSFPFHIYIETSRDIKTLT